MTVKLYTSHGQALSIEIKKQALDEIPTFFIIMIVQSNVSITNWG